MKKIIILAVFFFIISANLGFAQEIIDSKIEDVTLFSNQALIKRKAQVRVDKGLNDILIELKAFSVDENSVQAKVYGEGELYSVQFRTVYLEDAPQEEVRSLEQRIDDLKKEKKSLVNKKEILNKKERFLNSLVDFSSTQIPTELKTSLPKVEDLESILGFLEGNLVDISIKKEDLDKQIEEIDKEIEVLKKELNSIRVPAEKVKKGIQVLFNSDKKQKIDIEASYLVFNCSWQPVYKIDVPLNLEETNLIMFSKIRQKSGEDWEDIKLTVSNVIPLRGAKLPHLPVWGLDIRRRAQIMFDRRGVGGARKFMEMEQKAERIKEVPSAPAEFAYAKKKELPLSFEYELRQSLTIESKDKTTLLPLFTKTLDGEFFYQAVPKISPLTFLVYKTSADEELLSGPLNVYFGGRFVGSTHLSEKEPGEEFYLNLSADREVKVRRKKVKDKVDETFFGRVERKTIIRQLGFKIIVENLKDKPIQIHILDNVPVSHTDKIEVKDIKMSPEPTETDYQDKEGVNLWELEVNPQQSEDIDIEFTVTYPKDEPIYGL